jgi:hypothetical protein
MVDKKLFYCFFFFSFSSSKTTQAHKLLFVFLMLERWIIRLWLETDYLHQLYGGCPSILESMYATVVVKQLLFWGTNFHKFAQRS